MKDKRQRMAIAWPYAAVYTDPAFAASLLQAAASSLPLHYAPPPPVYPHHYPRYHPYPAGFGIPQPSSLPMTNPALGVNQNVGTIPQSLPQTMPPHGFNLNLGLDFPSYQNFDLKGKVSPRSSPVHSDISLSPPAHDGLLIPAKVSPTQTQLSAEKPKLFKPYKSEA